MNNFLLVPEVSFVLWNGQNKKGVDPQREVRVHELYQQCDATRRIRRFGRLFWGEKQVLIWCSKNQNRLRLFKRYWVVHCTGVIPVNLGNRRRK